MKKHGSIFSLFLTATMVLLLFGCKKGLTENEAQSTSKRSASTEMLAPPDVYVVGNENNQAKVWKNGVGTVLPGGADATGIFVDGTDVYICGYSVHPSTFNLVAVYWKNGVLTTLSDGSNEVIPMGIAVSGTNVYVAARIGLALAESVYYHNGVVHPLGISKANGVVVDESGNFYIPNGQEGSPSYWKNGTLIALQAGTSNVVVRGMAVKGGHVYAVGFDQVFSPTGSNRVAKYWKNGLLQPLTTPINTDAHSVAITSTGQAVIAGTSGPDLGNQHITYWPSVGDPNVLSQGTMVYHSVGIEVDATTGDLYVCGSEIENQSSPAKAKYWIISPNGAHQPITLNPGSSAAGAHAIALGY